MSIDGLAERIGRKKVLLYGWLSAIPIPLMVLLAPSWGWIVGIYGFVWGGSQFVTGVATSGFWFVAIAMFLSGALVMLWGEETHQRLNPQRE